MKSTELNSVLIVGCGWVGTELAKSLIAQNIHVYGTTRSTEKASSLRSSGIHPVILELEKNEPVSADLPDVDSIIISISPGRGDQRTQYPNHIRKLSELLASSNQQVIIYSSTSAYKGKQGVVTEQDAHPNSTSENVILAAEDELRKAIPESVILRLSGLFGSNRHPVHYFSGRKEVSNGEAPVNLVHRKDVIRASIQIMKQRVKNQIFNLCSDQHPTKKELYTALAEKMNLEAPTFESGGTSEKSVDGTKIKKELGFEYLHNDLFAFAPDPSFLRRQESKS